MSREGQTMPSGTANARAMWSPRPPIAAAIASAAIGAGVDPHRPARGEARVVVGGVVVDELDEHAAGGRDAVAGDRGEDARLRPAAGRIVGVRAGVAGPAVEHAVGAPGGAPAEAAPLEEGDVDAPGGEVARGPHAGGAPADDEDRGVVGDVRDAARGG
jgi:hypothetical protein